MAFRRFLSPDAVLAARDRFGPLLASAATVPGAAVHLRRGDEIAFYFLGHKALWLCGIGGPAESAQAWGRQERLEHLGLNALKAALGRAHIEIQKHVDRSRSDAFERVVQARALQRLDADSEFWLVDEQLQIPLGDLADPSLARVIPDALLVHRPTGDLWLLEVKLADSPDLDGPVLKQLDEILRIPGALGGGGCGAFTGHYAEVLRQRCILGLVPDAPPPLSGRVHGAILAIGDEAEALGRIACWDNAIPAGGQVAILGPSSPLELRAFRPCASERDRAISSSDRAPHAPRRSRWTPFALAEDARQEVWRNRNPAASQLGPLADVIAGYLERHDAPEHNELSHPRSSQAACLQVFAPLLGDTTLARAPRLRDAEVARCGLLACLNAEVLGVAGIVATEVTGCDFEVPHQGKCGSNGCAQSADMDDLAGEGHLSTRLDAWVELTGRQRGKAVRVAVGFEFKYSEVEFSCCGGFTSRGATRRQREACVTGAGRTGACLMRHRKGRKYLSEAALQRMFGRDLLADPGPCPFLGPANQLLRGVFVTGAHARRRGADVAFYLVLHDARNEVLLQAERPIPGFVAAEAGPVERMRQVLVSGAPLCGFGAVPVQALVHACREAAGSDSSVWLSDLCERYRWG